MNENNAEKNQATPDWQFNGPWPTVTLRIPIGINGNADGHQLRILQPEDAVRLWRELTCIIPSEALGLMPAALTCVYCGQAYPDGTPSSGAGVDALTSHIKICEKHPLRTAEHKITALRSALAMVVGATDPAELESIRTVIEKLPKTENTDPALNAIKVLLETA